MKVLLLCTYPHFEARHGGQIRVANIVDHYSRAGFDVDVKGVLGSANYAKTQGFVEFPSAQALAASIDNPFLMEDVALAGLFEKNDSYYQQLAGKIKDEPGLIHVEQPWLFGFARRLVGDRGWVSTKIIYGSQNIEYQLKAKILSAYLHPDLVNDYSDKVKQIELEATVQADGVVCVSEHDLLWHKSQTRTESILAANGVKPWAASEDGVDCANKISQCRKFALFCASAHPPNMSGFFDLFGRGLGSLSPGQRLIIAGSAGPAIASDPRLHASARLADSICTPGIVDEHCLSGLLATAHCIVLPVTQGGGTNLKTAEALWAGRYIVATSIAMRGFESFIGSPGVFVSDQPAEFKRNLRKAMEAPPLRVSDGEQQKREVVLWSQTLQPLSPFVAELHQQSSAYE